MKAIFLNFLFFLSLSCFSQVPEILWQQCYGSPDYDASDRAIGAVEKDNGYFFTIHLTDTIPEASNYHGGGDIWLINTDSVGNIIWERCYGGSSGDIPQKLIKQSDNEYFICGYTFSTDGDVQSGNNGEDDVWLVKLNAEGDIIWENTYGCTGYDEFRDMILTPDGGFIILDRIGINGGDVTEYFGSYDIWMCKCDALGNIEWEKTLGNEGLDNCISMIINDFGNIMMIGSVQMHGGMVECYPDGAVADVWIVELDLQGNILTQHCFGGTYYEAGVNLIQLTDGYIFAAVTSSDDGDVSGLHGPPNGWEDIWIVKLNNELEIIWQKCIGGFGGEFPLYLTQTLDNDFVILGITFSQDGDVSNNHSYAGLPDIWVIKLSFIGEIEWEQCYGGVDVEGFLHNSVIKKADNNFVIAGYMEFGPSYDVQCISNYNRQAWIFEIGIPDTTDIIDKVQHFDNLKTYPNPAQDYVIFEIDEYKENSSFQIINIFGEEITRLNAKAEKTVWDCKDVQSGIYFYRCTINGISKTGKIIISK